MSMSSSVARSSSTLPRNISALSAAVGKHEGFACRIRGRDIARDIQHVTAQGKFADGIGACGAVETAAEMRVVERQRERIDADGASVVHPRSCEPQFAERLRVGGLRRRNPHRGEQRAQIELVRHDFACELRGITQRSADGAINFETAERRGEFLYLHRREVFGQYHPGHLQPERHALRRKTIHAQDARYSVSVYGSPWGNFVCS
jgi:hypothetical protein